MRSSRVGELQRRCVKVTSTDDGNYRNLETSVPVANSDNDVAGIQITANSGTTTTEAGGTTALAVALTAQPSADVVVQLTSSDATEGNLPNQQPHLHSGELEHTSGSDGPRY